MKIYDCVIVHIHYFLLLSEYDIFLLIIFEEEFKSCTITVLKLTLIKIIFDLFNIKTIKAIK